MTQPRAALLALAVAAGCGPPPTWHGVSPDHRRSFSVRGQGGSTCVEVESEEPRCFDGVAISRIAFSPDSRHLAYPVEDDGRWYVVRDGVPGVPVDGVGEITFSPDGRRLAYAAERDGAWHVAVDGEFGAPFDSLRAGTLVFDATGRRFAYVAFISGGASGMADGAAGGVVAVVDGVEVGAHRAVSHLRFSPWDGSVAYRARDPDGARVYVDGVPGPAHQAIEAFAFDPQGGVAYVARDGGEAWVVRRSTRWGPYLGVAHVAFQPVGAALVFVARDSLGARVVFDGIPGPVYPAVDAPAFSARGPAWGYVAHDSTGSILMMDGAVADHRTSIGDLTFNADGSRYAYVTRSIDAELVVHDGGVEELDMVVDGTLHFLEPENRWTCLAGRLDQRRLFVVTEGVPERREFSWSAFIGVARGPLTPVALAGTVEEIGVEALRAWVSAEARLMLEGARQ